MRITRLKRGQKNYIILKLIILLGGVDGVGGMAGWRFISVRLRDDKIGTRAAGFEISLFAGHSYHE